MFPELAKHARRYNFSLDTVSRLIQLVFVNATPVKVNQSIEHGQVWQETTM